jgi:hypothetical protein
VPEITRNRALACLELIKISGRSRVSVDLHYCGIAFGRGSDRMNMEFPEAATERKMLFARELLVSKEEHLVTEECLVDLIEGCIIQLCQVGTLNLSTDIGG